LSYSPAWFKNIAKQLGKLKLGVSSSQNSHITAYGHPQ